jgi:tartrate-resistant acid phosphatase type 5
MFAWLPLIAILAATPVVQLPPAKTLRFAVVGDAGGTNNRFSVAFRMLRKTIGLDGILLVGDNFYPCGIAKVDDPQWFKVTDNFGPARVPIYPVLGNHDYGDPQERSGGGYKTCGDADPGAEVAATGKIPFWSFPARNYRLHGAFADILMIDSLPISLGLLAPWEGSLTAAQQKSWIANALGESTAPWKIVVGHHQIYSSGPHGRSRRPSQHRMKDLLPVLDAAGVDLYICGHDHHLELIGDPAKRLYLVAGGGGGGGPVADRNLQRDEPKTIYPASFPAKTYFGFALLELEASRLSITFYDAAGSKTAGPFVKRR